MKIGKFELEDWACGKSNYWFRRIKQPSDLSDDSNLFGYVALHKPYGHPIYIDFSGELSFLQGSYTPIKSINLEKAKIEVDLFLIRVAKLLVFA